MWNREIQRPQFSIHECQQASLLLRVPVADRVVEEVHSFRRFLRRWPKLHDLQPSRPRIATCNLSRLLEISPLSRGQDTIRQSYMLLTSMPQDKSSIDRNP